ncbi:hypothetical protein [Actinoplanes palleronii]|uniref:Anti-sigma factor n=1 Tax=Actinoplanes palleronii TaxID=113570 RepID=A0ABQ4B9E7_9ACTN|nr:hypothetical protein [Actinoplanes palleronii]GIE67339.1 hypothetical protein Apa02nite_034470 [Actinoplanes palleronii]
MADEFIETDQQMRASERLCAFLGLPPPKPLTEAERKAFEEWMDDGDRQVRELRARRDQAAA